MDLPDRNEPESVIAGLLYLSDPHPRDFHSTAGWPGRSGIRQVTITNAWRSAGLTLDRNGFCARRMPSTVANFYNESEVRERFYPELAQFLTAAAGASSVTIFAHDVRSSAGMRPDDQRVREPVAFVHNDYTPDSGPRMVRQTLAAPEAEDRLTRRFAEINVWRPIKGPVLEQPLAVCDAGSIAPGDLVGVSQGLRHEVFMLRYNPAHRWYYFPRMNSDEVILIKGFDSAIDGRARFTAHAAFADPSTPPGAPARESIEARALLFFD